MQPSANNDLGLIERDGRTSVAADIEQPVLARLTEKHTLLSESSPYPVCYSWVELTTRRNGKTGDLAAGRSGTPGSSPAFQIGAKPAGDPDDVDLTGRIVELRLGYHDYAAPTGVTAHGPEYLFSCGCTQADPPTSGSASSSGAPANCVKITSLSSGQSKTVTLTASGDGTYSQGDLDDEGRKIVLYFYGNQKLFLITSPGEPAQDGIVGPATGGTLVNQGTASLGGRLYAVNASPCPTSGTGSGTPGTSTLIPPPPPPVLVRVLDSVCLEPVTSGSGTGSSGSGGTLINQSGALLLMGADGKPVRLVQRWKYILAQPATVLSQNWCESAPPCNCPSPVVKKPRCIRITHLASRMYLDVTLSPQADGTWRGTVTLGDGQSYTIIVWDSGTTSYFSVYLSGTNGAATQGGQLINEQEQVANTATPLCNQTRPLQLTFEGAEGTCCQPLNGRTFPLATQDGRWVLSDNSIGVHYLECNDGDWTLRPRGTEGSPCDGSRRLLVHGETNPFYLLFRLPGCWFTSACADGPPDTGPASPRIFARVTYAPQPGEIINNTPISNVIVSQTTDRYRIVERACPVASGSASGGSGSSGSGSPINPGNPVVCPSFVTLPEHLTVQVLSAPSVCSSLAGMSTSTTFDATGATDTYRGTWYLDLDTGTAGIHVRFECARLAAAKQAYDAYLAGQSSPFRSGNIYSVPFQGYAYCTGGSTIAMDTQYFNQKINSFTTSPFALDIEILGVRYLITDGGA